MLLQPIDIEEIRDLKSTWGEFVLRLAGLCEGQITENRHWYWLIKDEQQFCIVEVRKADPDLYPSPYTPKKNDYVLIFSPDKDKFDIVLPQPLLLEIIREVSQRYAAKRLWLINRFYSHLLLGLPPLAPVPTRFSLTQTITLVIPTAFSGA
ncbi:MAG: hypothetical protein P0Y53_01330 [Candidatus Pseudobacter hemicellulosilyticus]|uniref:Uncharacterized protein n=1 Tax=Candidatus Pseudobacter hemicellulosilyticus TaxID=3121375 RepID=A0AAJ5WRS1_9BACT|nr:MAG: hypothetical protein P0Y53_01330 [Pseudobacter sp.]